MKKEKIYRYLGRNGNITTPILIEGTNPLEMYRLIADEGKIFIKGDRYTTVVDVFPDELNDWTEIDKPQE